MKLTRDDYAALEQSYITRKIADEARLYRVASIEGRDLVGRRGPGDFSGTVYSYHWPGETHATLERLRLDNPPLDAATGKPEHKYLSPPNARNRLYFPPCPAALLADAGVPLIVTEGEKKVLALWRMALESANGKSNLPFLPVGLAGCWGFRGTVGACTNAKGERVPEKGVLPDFDRIAWQKRKVTVLFDSNAATNAKVLAARRELARELARRGAEVWLADLPAAAGVNGCDDFLHLFGAAKLDEVLRQAHRYDWRKELIRSDKDKPLAILANAITALRSAPEWCGVLGWDEFAMRVVALRESPWGQVEAWTDQEDRRATEWLQRHGILVRTNEAGQAVQTVAKDNAFHPVRQYLESLKWDGIPRIDDWLTLYLGVDPLGGDDKSKDDEHKQKHAALIRAIAARWLISGVARIFKPGCKVDCCLILEGPQGIGKSSALRTLGGEWYSDDVAELGTKDAALGTRGKWILEFAELDSIAKATPSKIKAFISRAVDHFRLPYDRRAGDFPRECIFAGTVNHAAYLRDETGGRRFWPVTCGRMNLVQLGRDRDQLWAEAVARYHKEERWWLDTPELIAAAEGEQDERYDDDPWQEPISQWLSRQAEADTSVSEVLRGAITKPVEQWTQADMNRVARVLVRLGWKRYRKRDVGRLEWRYRQKEQSS